MEAGRRRGRSRGSAFIMICNDLNYMCVFSGFRVILVSWARGEFGHFRTLGKSIPTSTSFRAPIISSDPKVRSLAEIYPFTVIFTTYTLCQAVSGSRLNPTRYVRTRI